MFNKIMYLVSIMMFGLNYFIWKNDREVLFWGILSILILLEGRRINE
jgi:hypothetical protein